MSVNAMVVGHGSIGARHVQVLQALGHKVSIVSRREIHGQQRFATIDDALCAGDVEYVVIALETSRHFEAAESLARLNFKGRVLIEKPLGQSDQMVPVMPSGDVYVAYTLRCDPLLRELRAELVEKSLISAEMRAASYLPNWRPGRDYRNTASASKASGGGVLRDLSHELDFGQWILGSWTSVAAVGGHYSELEIDTDDIFSVLSTSDQCPVISLNLNYIDRQPEERWMIVNSNEGTYKLDLIGRTLSRNGEVIARTATKDIETCYDEMYYVQHREILAGNRENVCTLADGLRTVRLIGAIEEASNSRTWVDL